MTLHWTTLNTSKCVAVVAFQTFPNRQWLAHANYQDTIGAFRWLTYAPGDVFEVVAFAKWPPSNGAQVWLAKRPGDTWKECDWIWEKHCALVQT